MAEEKEIFPDKDITNELCPGEKDIALFLSNVKEVFQKEAEVLFGKSDIDVELYADLKFEIADIERFAFDPNYIVVGIPLKEIDGSKLVGDPASYATSFVSEHIFDLVHELGRFFDGIHRGMDEVRDERRVFMKDNPDIPKALYNAMPSELA